MLKEYIASHDLGTEGAEAPVEIKSVLEDPSDFKQFTNSVIFTRESDMRTWLYSKFQLGVKNSTLHKKIDFSDANLTEPFIYQDTNFKFYIIQNVATSSFKRAINTAYNWYTIKVNYGYEATDYSDGDVYPSHVIYGITAGNIPEPIKDNRNGNEKFLQILDYGENHYAAMLPM
jgi:hypothetical protein